MFSRKTIMVCSIAVSSVLISSCSTLMDKDTYIGKDKEVKPAEDIVSTAEKAAQEKSPELFEKALDVAQGYVDGDSVSEKKLYEKLKKDINNDEAIKYALDNVDVDYTKEIQQALKEIEKTTGLSTNDMVDILVADGFTREMIENALKEYHLNQKKAGIKLCALPCFLNNMRFKKYCLQHIVLVHQ